MGAPGILFSTIVTLMCLSDGTLLMLLHSEWPPLGALLPYVWHFYIRNSLLWEISLLLSGTSSM